MALTSLTPVLCWAYRPGLVRPAPCVLGGRGFGEGCDDDEGGVTRNRRLVVVLVMMVGVMVVMMMMMVMVMVVVRSWVRGKSEGEYKRR